MLWDNPTFDGIAATHGSPLKKTHNESVSTDLHALSRGFIPGGKVTMMILLCLTPLSAGT